MFGGKKKAKAMVKKSKGKVLATLSDKDRQRLVNQFRLCADARITSAMMQNSYDALWMEFKGRYELGESVGGVNMDTGEVYEAEGPLASSANAVLAPSSDDRG